MRSALPERNLFFTGGARSWSVVEGPDEPIIVVRKDSGWSPEFFRQRVMNDEEIAEDAVIVDSKEDVVAEVSTRPWSIGVTGMPEAIPALNRVSVIRLVSDRSAEVSTYALRRPLYFFSVEDSPPVQLFLDYVTGDEAQGEILETGFFPAPQTDALAAN